MQKLCITVGLPGSGKSTYIRNNQLDGQYYIVSADEIKKSLDGYTPTTAHLVHEESIMIAESDVENHINIGHSVLMDGGGINNNYTMRIIENAKNVNPNIIIEVLYFNTPLNVCLERVRQRERYVPVDDICKKNAMLPKCIHKLKQVADSFTQIDYYTNKHIFIDMDGTICAFTKAPLDAHNCIDFVNSDLFIYLEPVDSIINYVNSVKDATLYILTASPNSIAWEHKKMWLKKYMPNIKTENIFFVGNKDYKDVFLRQLMLKLKLSAQDITMIDDTHSILDKMSKIGVNAIHPSNIKSIQLL